MSALALVAATGCAAQSDDGAGGDGQSQNAITGGTRDQRWSASGYLVSGASDDHLDTSHVVCGATLIAPRVVVTAAHCVADAGTAFAFGTGDVGTSPLLHIVERHAHPGFHPVAVGTVDLTHVLRNFDVAYLVLDHDASVKPATLIGDKPAMGCGVEAIGDHADQAKPVRKSTPACVLFDINLGDDPIFELHPAESSALCVGDGDEGSAVVQGNADAPVLVGIFAGSVTGFVTDCRRGTQFLDGYESMFGYGDFLRQGIASVAR